MKQDKYCFMLVELDHILPLDEFLFLFFTLKLIEIFTFQLDMTQYETIVLKLGSETKSIGNMKEVKKYFVFQELY
jgi:hypothetical protein